MNLRSNYFLGLQNSLFNPIIKLSAVLITIVISLIELKNLIFIELHYINWFLSSWTIDTLTYTHTLKGEKSKFWEHKQLSDIIILHQCTKKYDHKMFGWKVMVQMDRLVILG